MLTIQTITILTISTILATPAIAEEYHCHDINNENSFNVPGVQLTQRMEYPELPPTPFQNGIPEPFFIPSPPPATNWNYTPTPSPSVEHRVWRSSDEFSQPYRLPTVESVEPIEPVLGVTPLPPDYYGGNTPVIAPWYNPGVGAGTEPSFRNHDQYLERY